MSSQSDRIRRLSSDILSLSSMVELNIRSRGRQAGKKTKNTLWDKLMRELERAFWEGYRQGTRTHDEKSARESFSKAESKARTDLNKVLEFRPWLTGQGGPPSGAVKAFGSSLEKLAFHAGEVYACQTTEG